MAVFDIVETNAGILPVVRISIAAVIPALNKYGSQFWRLSLLCGCSDFGN